MRKMRVEDAVGEVLCHDMTAILADGFKGVRFKRGHVITEADIPALLDMGKSHVFVWEPEADEVHEDDAAMALTQAMCGPGLQTAGPSEGKMQISASMRGLFCLDREALREINRVGDYTVACRPALPPWRRAKSWPARALCPWLRSARTWKGPYRLPKRISPFLPYCPINRCAAALSSPAARSITGASRMLLNPSSGKSSRNSAQIFWVL